MKPIRFPKEGNKFWPLPPDYDTLDLAGQRMARVNACLCQETSEDWTAAWAFFRTHYLFPPTDGRERDNDPPRPPVGMLYKHGIVPSPPMHYQIVRDVHRYPLLVYAAPRSFAKSSIFREINLLELVTQPFHETVIFLNKQETVTEQFDIYISQLENNQRLVHDFVWYWGRQMGIRRFKPIKGQGLWNRHQIKTTIGSMLTGIPIKGGSLGKRPHRIEFDDVERDDSMIKEPADQKAAFYNMLMNVVYPMAESGTSIDILGTVGSTRRTFLYDLVTTNDPRITGHWHRIRLAVKMNGENLWNEKMGTEWQEQQKSTMGVAAFNAQYMNEPGTEQERVFVIHPKLTCYYIDDRDEEYESEPLASRATLRSYINRGKAQGREDYACEEVRRPFGEAASHMYRFITVDWAKTVSYTSDFSAIHVMGLESSKTYKNVLWSLDLFVGKVTQDELVRRMYQMALKWGVRLCGVEAYGVQLEFYERVRSDLPEMFGRGEVPPSVVPLKFPPRWEKPDKIAGLEWRFRDFKVKLPGDRRGDEHYAKLWQQIEDFTPDLALLEHDDAIDTLAMHQVIGKQRTPTESVKPSFSDPIGMMRGGRFHHPVTGLPLLGSVSASELPNDVLWSLRKRMQEQEEEESRIAWSAA